MYLFEIVSMEPLEPFGDLKYGSFTQTEHDDALLFLEKAGKSMVLHKAQLNQTEQHCAARVYTDICHDRIDNCYWCCAGKNSDIIYKLSSTLHEIDRFRFCDYDVSLGAVRSIAWDSHDDCLILTYAGGVKSVDKRSFCELPVCHCVCAFPVHACIRSCRCYCYLGRCCDMELLTIVKDGQTVIHCCLPACHRFLAMTEICETHGPVIRFLCVRHGTYPYLMNGVLLQHDPSGSDSHRTKDPHCCRPCDPKKQTEKRPARRFRRKTDCREHKDHNHDCEQHKEHHHNKDRPRHCEHHRDCDRQEHLNGDRNPGDYYYDYDHWAAMWEYRFGSYASIIESIALEQTALSHILNAEGEKIQRVIAVSEQPEDFLSVNRSVLDMITKVTHLEQVLFSKLELACRALTEGDDQAEDNS